ncbi:hypothetical protein AgCh_011820 [Apium graveolens]
MEKGSQGDSVVKEKKGIGSTAPHLVSELDKVKESELVFDVAELERVRGEIEEMKKAKGCLETQLSEMARAQETSSSKISSLMTENTNLSNECNSMSRTMKEQVLSLAEVEGKLAKLKVEHEEELQVVLEARDGVKRELVEVKASLA